MEKLINHDVLIKIICENGNDNIQYILGVKNIKGINYLLIKGIKISDSFLEKLNFKKRKTREVDKEKTVPPKPPALRDLIQKNNVLIQKNSDAIMDLTKLMTGFFVKQDENWKVQKEFNAKQDENWKVQKEFNKDQREFNAKQDENWKVQKEFNKDQREFNAKQDENWKAQKTWNAAMESKVNTILVLPTIQKELKENGD